MTRWSELTGDSSGSAYAARFAALAAGGLDVHGEAAFCAGLVPAPARVLDAGCGTGRVAIRLADLGYECVGVDADLSMLAAARDVAPDLEWRLADLASLALDCAPFDLVVLAGNVVPLLAANTLPAVVAALANHLRPGGVIVSGFGLAGTHLPRGCPVTPLRGYAQACAAAGFTPVRRCAGWDGAPWHDGGYVVAVHRR